MSSAAAAPSAAPSNKRRILIELRHCHRWKHPNIIVRSADENLSELHFVLHDLPSASPYVGGCYHGKVTFPPEYPLTPPGIQMLTPSGRFRTNADICTTASNWHRENWNPDWTVMTILIGFLSLFLDDVEGGVGHILSAGLGSEANRRKLARSSWHFNAGDGQFRELFPEFVRDGTCVTDADEGVDSNGRLITEVESEASLQRAAESPPPGDAQGVEPEKRETDEVPTGEVAFCRLCLQGEETEKLLEPAPCLCRGTMGGVHASCLEEWIQHSGNLTCGTCNQRYTSEDLDLVGMDALIEIMAKLLAIHTGSAQGLLITCIFATSFFRESMYLCSQKIIVACFLLTMVGGRLTGHYLVGGHRQRHLRQGAAVSLEAPSLPGALVTLLRDRWAARNRRGVVDDPDEVHDGGQDDRAASARAARPDVGVACMLGGVLLYVAAVRSCGSVDDGLVMLLTVCIFFAFSSRMACVRSLSYLHMPKSQQKVIFGISMKLCAIYVGCSWAFLISAVCTAVFFRRTVGIVLNWFTLMVYLGSMCLGLVYGLRVTEPGKIERRAVHLEGAAAPLLPRELGEVAHHLILQRLQICRAVRDQILRTWKPTIALGCTLGCIVVAGIVYFLLGSAVMSVDLLCIWHVFLTCTVYVVMRRLRAEWQVRVLRFKQVNR